MAQDQEQFGVQCLAQGHLDMLMFWLRMFVIHPNKSLILSAEFHNLSESLNHFKHFISFLRYVDGQVQPSFSKQLLSEHQDQSI